MNVMLSSNHLQRQPQEIEEVIYKAQLSVFIEREIYPNNPEAVKGNWRLGALHREWDELIQKLRLRILAPRDHLKTFYFSTAYPTLRLRFNPNDEIYIFSKTDKQAVKILDAVKRTIRRTPILQPLAQGRGVDFWNKTEIRCANGSTMYAQGFWSAIRGGHPDVIILDDVIDSQVVYSDEQNKKAIERYLQDILPMAEPDTQIIFVGTLQRDNDIYNTLDPTQWALKTYDAIVNEQKHITLFPEKWDWERLMKRKAELSYEFGEKFFLKLGEIIKPEWIKYYDRPDEVPEGTAYTGWDLSVGKKPKDGDYTAGVSFIVDKQGNYWITNIVRGRWNFPTRLKKVFEVQQHHPAKKIRIEDNTFQTDTVQTLIRETNMPIEGVQSSTNKIQNFNEELAPLFENGKVYIRRDMRDFVNELLSLPRGKNDDMADAFLIGKKGIGTVGEPRIRWIG